MLGGLLAGSLLGSLLLGGGFNGGGFLDIILIGGLLFLAFKFFSRRRAATQGAGQPNAGGFDSLRSTPGSDSTHQRTAAPQSGKGGFDWEALTTPSSGQQPLYQDEPKKPAGFDEEEFLRGAKAAYTRLNNAWDKRDLSAHPEPLPTGRDDRPDRLAERLGRIERSDPGRRLSLIHI